MLAGSYRSRVASRPTNIMPPALNNHITESASTVPVTPSTPVAANPPRITQSFMPPAIIKPIHDTNVVQTVNVTNTNTSTSTTTNASNQSKHENLNHVQCCYCLIAVIMYSTCFTLFDKNRENFANANLYSCMYVRIYLLFLFI